MHRAAIYTAILAFALLSSLASAGDITTNTATNAAVKAVSPVNQAVAQAPSTAPKPGTVDSAKAKAAPVQTAVRVDSAVARRYKVGPRKFSKDEATYFLTVLNFKVKGKPESTAVNWVYRDERGALLTYEKGRSEWAFSYDTVAFLDPKEYVADSLIRTRTDGLLKDFLRERSSQYSFVNFEKTMAQARDTGRKEGAAPAVPAYYIGRYLRKLGGRYVLGDNFQVRIGVGRANAPTFISFRDPVLTDSAMMDKVPTKEMVQIYLDKWAKDKRRLGTRYYPYHPDKLRIKALKPVKVFESYVLSEEKFRDNPSKDGTYLVPKVTVLAEATLSSSAKRLKLPAPAAPVLLHFHFPCTPGAGLCWPDGKQGLEDGSQVGAGSQPPPPSQSTPAPTAPKPEIPAPAR